MVTFVQATFVLVAFVQATFVLVTFVTIRNISLSCYWPNFDQTLKIGSWELLEQMPFVIMTFIQATYVLTTFLLGHLSISEIFQL